MNRSAPLAGGYRVADLSASLSGTYATKILADAGAEVIVVEPPGGVPLRWRSASGGPVDDQYGGVLFQSLSCAKRSVVVDHDQPTDHEMLQRLLRGCDAVLWSEDAEIARHWSLTPEELLETAPHISVLALSPFGLDSPWRGRPANEFTLQAMTGNGWLHGPSEGPPTMIGGAYADYAVGVAAALALLVSRERFRQCGRGEVIDLAALDLLNLTQAMYQVTYLDLAKRPNRAKRCDPLPGIHRAKDGWVGLWVTTGQNWLDFCSLLGRDDWYADKSLGLMDNRALRHEELDEVINQWAGERTVAEIVELASLFRIPVAPILNGRSLPTVEHFVEHEYFTEHPRTGVVQPAVWYRLSTGAARSPAGGSPALGEHTDDYRQATLGPLTPRPVGPPADGFDPALPLTGLRVGDMTAYWAGPLAAQTLAFLGADVIHIESAKRPDGIRMAATRPFDSDGWWETSPFFNAANTNKRDIAIDGQTDRGRALLKQLLASCDVVIENFSPRVMNQLGLSYDSIQAQNPQVVMLRAPAFGLSGPWADLVGYAPIFDYASGVAWVTGHPDGRPTMTAAPADAVGGLHAAVAVLLGLEQRRRTGTGLQIESPLVGALVNVAGEQVVEYSANGILLERVGNRSWTVAPQGVYQTADMDRTDVGGDLDDWVAISVESDEQWRHMCTAIGAHQLAAEPSLSTVAGRRAAHVVIDQRIAEWSRQLSARQAAEILSAAGVPAAAVIPAHEVAGAEPIVARELYETVEHPVAGDMRIIGFPVRFAARPKRWHRTPAPRLGEHNTQILTEELGLDQDEVGLLERDGVIGTRAGGNLGW